jgi:uncharacterized protein
VSEIASSEERDFFTAVCEGDALAVETHLGKGADPNGRDSQQRPALYLAAFHGHAEVVRTLVRAGADVNCQIDDDPEAAARSRAAARDRLAQSRLRWRRGVGRAVRATSSVLASP